MKDNEDLTGSWFYMDNSSSDDNERYYYYSVPVAPGDMTSRLINKVTYTGDIPENAHFELKVLAEGCLLSRKTAGQTGLIVMQFNADIIDYIIAM